MPDPRAVRVRSSSQTALGVVEILAAAAIAAAWFVFRLERYGAHERDVRGARGALTAVKRGMVEGPSQGDEGWGELYFSTTYSRITAVKRALETKRFVHDGVLDQVLVVPTEPLELLATASAGDGLIGEETITAANDALWRVRVFNQFVWLQTEFNSRHVAEIHDRGLNPGRRDVLANAAGLISSMLHIDGIGSANAPGGWYRRLKDAIDGDLDRLAGREAFRSWYLDSRVWIAFDLVAAGLVVTSVAVAVA